MKNVFVNRHWMVIALSVMTGAAGAAGVEEPGVRALQQNQLQRQQQQEALQLRMQQQQRVLQSPPANASGQGALERRHVEQQLEQGQMHYRQAIEPVAAQPSDDADTRRARGEMQQQKASDEGQRQLLRFGSEGQQQGR